LFCESTHLHWKTILIRHVPFFLITFFFYYGLSPACTRKASSTQDAVKEFDDEAKAIWTPAGIREFVRLVCKEIILQPFPGQYRKAFLISGIPALLGLLSLIVFVKDRKAAKHALPKRFSFKDLPPRFYVFLAIVFMFTLGNSTDALLLIKAGDVGIDPAFIPIMYLIYNSVSVLFSVPAGVLSDRIGRERLIIFGYLLYSIIYLGFGRAATAGPVIGLFALYGLYSASTDGVQKALVTDIVDPKLKGTGLGIYNFLVGITLLPASIIAGLLYDRIDNRAPFYFGAVMALSAAVLMFFYYMSGKGVKETENGTSS